MLAKLQDIEAVLRCPRCGGRLTLPGAETQCAPRCSNAACGLSRCGFQSMAGQPILVDFEDSVLEEAAFRARAGASVRKRDPARRSFISRLRRLAMGENQAALRFSGELIAGVKALSARPRVLLIGGGEVGYGTASLYAEPSVDVISVDIYTSSRTTLVADAHRLPFADQSMDGVWIQAVLEHVLDPGRVVDEIYRVLKPRGLVFADTPFMQQVHEGAYDFTRFTLSGHRWLFRRFKLIDAGFSGGPGSALNWAIRYFVRALTGSEKLATAVRLAFFWLRFFDRWPSGRFAADAACAVFFYGERDEAALAPRGIIEFYEAQRSLTARGLERPQARRTGAPAGAPPAR
jgi:SAM-dependent methyltransferase